MQTIFMGRFTLEEITNMPTIHSGQYDDLKLENGDIKVWLSRLSIEDGQPYNNQVTVEKLVKNKQGVSVWKTIEQYQAK